MSPAEDAANWSYMPEGPPVLEPQDSPHHPLARWFKMWRDDRAAHRPVGVPVVPKTRAVITMVHNESVFLPIWLRYYSRFFRPEDIYVLDNDTTDGSTDRDGFVRIPVGHDKVDHRWMVSRIQDLQHELIERYDVVLVGDVDELIAPVPEKGPLDEYLDRYLNEEWLNCLCYELLHLAAFEAPFRPDRAVLDQRRDLVPQRRLQQGCGDRGADDMETGLSRT